MADELTGRPYASFVRHVYFCIVRQFFASFLLRVAPLLMWGIASMVVWFLVAPRDPGGGICASSTPVRTAAAFVRGMAETGCPAHDQPIAERPWLVLELLRGR
jgi:hypothetical protein